MEKETALLNGNIKKTYISYLVPTIMGMLANSVYCIVDVMFVGLYLGSKGLAAFNIAMPIFTLYSSIGLMLGVGGATTISVLVGQGDKKNVDKVFSFTVFCSLAIGIIISVFGLVFLEPFSIIMGATPELLPGVKEYLFPLQCTAMFYILNCTMQVVIRSDYNPKLVMAAALTGNGLNILFDWLFVGVFKWGLIGASTATAIGPIVAVCILSFHYITHRNTMHFTLRFLNRQLITRLFKNGIGTFILEFSLGAVVFMFNFVLLRVSGDSAVAVYAIASNIAYVGKGIFNGISQAAQPLISVNYGAGNFLRIKASTKVALTTAIVFSTLSFIVILIFAEPLVSFFLGANATEKLVIMGAESSRIYFTSFIFTAVNTVLMYYFQSVENIKATTIIALLRGIVLVAVGLGIFPAILGITGVWITITFAEGLTLLLALYLKKRQDNILNIKFNLDNCNTHVTNILGN